jgi:FKBP-type peptidyl-prolyl cis-trans isomerase SlyD
MADGMVVGPGRLVEVTFVVVDDATDEVLDRERATTPHAFVVGRGQMPAGFEARLSGKAPGETFEFVVPEEEAFGAHNNQLVQKVKRSSLPEGIVVGMVIELEVDGVAAAPLLFHVASVGEEVVKLDGNHPFAGRSLRFMGKVRDVRPATLAP